MITVILFRDNVKEMNRKSTGWEKVFVKHVSDKGLESRLYKELII